MVVAERRHRGVERAVGERQRLRRRAHHGGGARRALGDHHLRRLDRDDLAVARLVGARPGADVEDRPRVAERGVDRGGDPRVLAADPRVADPDRVVQRAHGLTSLADTIPAGWTTVAVLPIKTFARAKHRLSEAVERARPARAGRGDGRRRARGAGRRPRARPRDRGDRRAARGHRRARGGRAGRPRRPRGRPVRGGGARRRRGARAGRRARPAGARRLPRARPRRGHRAAGAPARRRRGDRARPSRRGHERAAALPARRDRAGVRAGLVRPPRRARPRAAGARGAGAPIPSLGLDVDTAGRPRGPARRARRTPRRRAARTRALLERLQPAHAAAG